MVQSVVSAAHSRSDLHDSRMLFDRAVMRMNAAMWRVTDLQRTCSGSHPNMQSAYAELAAHRENVRATLKDFRAAALQNLVEENHRIQQQRDDLMAELAQMALLH